MIIFGYCLKNSDKLSKFQHMPRNIDFRDAILQKNYGAHILVKKFKKNMQKSTYTLFTQ